MKRETDQFLVRDLIRLLDKLPANQPLWLDIPELDTLRTFTGESYEEKDGKEPIVVLNIEALPE